MHPCAAPYHNGRMQASRPHTPHIHLESPLSALYTLLAAARCCHARGSPSHTLPKNQGGSCEPPVARPPLSGLRLRPLVAQSCLIPVVGPPISGHKLRPLVSCTAQPRATAALPCLGPLRRGCTARPCLAPLRRCLVARPCGAAFTAPVRGAALLRQHPAHHPRCPPPCATACGGGHAQRQPIDAACRRKLHHPVLCIE